MSVYVVDASVAVKWMFPETLAAEALRLQSPVHRLHAPAFIEVELANVLWKKLRQGLVTRAEADAFIAQLPNLPLVRHADSVLVPAAFDLADRTGRSVYDSMYLAVAIQVAGQMVTADDRLFNSLSNSAYASFVLQLESLP
jgi:predicted nucleic acid-binding protein